MKTLQEIKEKQKAARDNLRAMQKAELKKVKAQVVKAANAEKKVERKAMNRAKYMLAGDLLLEMKLSGNFARLEALLAKQQNDTDKKAVSILLASVKAPIPPPKKEVPKTTAQAIAKPEQKRGLFK